MTRTTFAAFEFVAAIAAASALTLTACTDDDTTTTVVTTTAPTTPMTQTSPTDAQPTDDTAGPPSTGETSAPSTDGQETTVGSESTTGDPDTDASTGDRPGDDCLDPVGCSGDGACPHAVLVCDGATGECGCSAYVASHPDACSAIVALAEAAGVGDPYLTIVADECASGGDTCRGSCFAAKNYCAQVGDDCDGLYEACGCVLAAFGG